jgi:hypothetical protein
MIRKLKVLSLALGAVFAMGAMMASTASATDFFTNEAGKGSDLLTGFSHDNVFKIVGGTSSFKCTTSRFAATATHGSSSVTVDVEYSGTPNVVPHTARCLGSPGSQKLEVDISGCDYDLSGNTVTGEDGTDAEIWITCPKKKRFKSQTLRSESR